MNLCFSRSSSAAAFSACAALPDVDRASTVLGSWGAERGRGMSWPRGWRRGAGGMFVSPSLEIISSSTAARFPSKDRVRFDCRALTGVPGLASAAESCSASFS